MSGANVEYLLRNLPFIADREKFPRDSLLYSVYCTYMTVRNLLFARVYRPEHDENYSETLRRLFELIRVDFEKCFIILKLMCYCNFGTIGGWFHK